LQWVPVLINEAEVFTASTNFLWVRTILRPPNRLTVIPADSFQLLIGSTD